MGYVMVSKSGRINGQCGGKAVRTQMAGNKNSGRKTKFNAEMMIPMLKVMCRLGATDAQLAEGYEVSNATINNWKNDHPIFLETIKKCKAEADLLVERSLFERALGYTHPEVHVSTYQGDVTITDIEKHYPPDSTSAIFWLKNRQPDRWRDIRAIEMVNEGDDVVPWEGIESGVDDVDGTVTTH